MYGIMKNDCVDTIVMLCFFHCPHCLLRYCVVCRYVQLMNCFSGLLFTEKKERHAQTVGYCHHMIEYVQS